MVKILTFESSSKGDISHAVIKQSTPVPASFILCYSLKENIIDNNSAFTIYGETGEAWLSLSNWVMWERVIMWARVNRVWIKIREIQTYEINYWLHVCLLVNTETGDLSLSLNGEPPIRFKNTELTIQAPKNLAEKIYLGFGELGYTNKQFNGQVANLNIFTMRDEEDIVKMSANLCSQVGDAVSYDTEWKFVGDVNEKEDDSWKICDRDLTYLVGIPNKMSWEDAEKVCDKLGKSKITDKLEPLVKNLTNNCEQIWSPISDEEVEGEFRNTISGQLVTDVPWAQGGPNGNEEQNNVAVELVSGAYNDVHSSEYHCVVCELNKTTQFTLTGVCKDSYFGKLSLF